jgi:hypothetical protein
VSLVEIGGSRGRRLLDATAHSSTRVLLHAGGSLTEWSVRRCALALLVGLAVGGLRGAHRYSTVQFFDTRQTYAENGRPADAFVLRDGQICEKQDKELMDGRVETKIVVVEPKASGGGFKTLAEFVGMEGGNAEFMDYLFTSLRAILVMLRMIRLQPSVRLPIPQLEAHGCVCLRVCTIWVHACDSHVHGSSGSGRVSRSRHVPHGPLASRGAGWWLRKWSGVV